MAMPMPEPSTMFMPVSDRWTAADLDHLPENGIRYEVLNGQLVVNPAVDNQLWTAIKHDGLKGFAALYPATVTPQVVP